MSLFSRRRRAPVDMLGHFVATLPPEEAAKFLAAQQQPTMTERIGNVADRVAAALPQGPFGGGYQPGATPQPTDWMQRFQAERDAALQRQQAMQASVAEQRTQQFQGMQGLLASPRFSASTADPGLARLAQKHGLLSHTVSEPRNFVPRFDQFGRTIQGFSSVAEPRDFVQRFDQFGRMI